MEDSLKEKSNMREIKFRGRNYDGVWMYGYLMPTPKPQIHPNNQYCISVCSQALTSVDKALYEVETDTIGQFTGLHDKNGKEIYEGDIVKRERKSLRVRGFPEKTFSEVGYIGFKRNDGRYVMVTSNSECSLCEPYAVQMEVIGNIHDNPELKERYLDRQENF